MLFGMSAGLLSRTESVSPVTATDATVERRSGRGLAWWWLGLLGCVVVATLLRVWGAAANSGVGNSYYTAAALSMSQDWSAFFTGGLDSEAFVSIDKPAAWLWPSALLIKAFGLSWATLFLPSVVAGVLAVPVLAFAVREGFGEGTPARVAGLLAALGLAVSPMNVVVDRNNNPDAILLFVLLLAAWLAVRAVRRGKLAPLIGSGALVGLAFNVKYFEAYMVVPGLALAWLVCANVPLVRRFVGVALMGLATIVVSAVWPLVIAFTPAAERPWIAGTEDGTVVNRLTGVVDVAFAPPQFTGGFPGAPDAETIKLIQMVQAFTTGEVFHAGPAGKSRLFSGVLADQVGWWLPLAVFAALIMAIGPRAAGRWPGKAGLVMWSGWALACWAVFSFMGGVLHPYYTSILVPAVIALAASGVVTSWMLWRQGNTFGKVTLIVQIVLVTAWSAWVLTDTSGQRPGWLVAVVLATGLAAAALVAGRFQGRAVVAVLAVVAAVAAPLTWSIKTADQHLLGGNPLANQPGRYEPALLPPEMADAFMNQMEPRIAPELVDFLVDNKGDARWIAATLTAMSASPLIVAAGGEPVMALGGYDGRDPIPTLERFQEFVAAGEIRYVLAPPEGNGTNSFLEGPPIEIIKWASTTCTTVPTPGANDVHTPTLLDCG